MIDALLDEVLELSDVDRRRRMDALARRYPRLYSWLARLISASEQPTTHLETLFQRAGGAAVSAMELERITLPPGTRVGGWRLIEPAGAGGMGLVYRAERADGAFEMTAAVKFIRSPDNPLMAERLALESRLLARLEHPNIARILDGGTLPDGQNYLVMEWVEGEDLAQCRETHDIAHRNCLALFIDIAEAVSHAHQRQVVHGDIKPSNVRIARDGRPRLLDFGVARLISGDGVQPETGTALTPAFSAPEQTAGKPASTQSDIYALGSLLRWMLTGSPGRDERPIKPGALNTPRPRALAAIINKATAPDPEQRYDAVPELVRDIRRLLAMHPVSAAGHSTAARIGLWTRRHQLAASLAGLALISVVAAVAGISWQARIAAAERDAAQFEAERSTMLREQLVLLFREVGRNSSSEDLSTRELLAESVEMAQRLHADDPQMLASIKALLGEIHIAMNDFAGAEPLLESFVNHKPNLASPLMQAVVRADLAQIRLRQGESEQALQLADSALEILRESPARNTERIADVLQIRGQALRGRGRWDEAIAELREAVRLAQTQPYPSRLRATAANNLATTLVYAGRSNEALPWLRKGLDNWRALNLEDGSSALTIMVNLAGILQRRGELAEAESLYREAIRRRKERFGESGALAAARLNLGLLLAIRHQIPEAREQVQRGMRLMARFEGRDSLNHVRARMARGRVALAGGEHDQALEDLAAARERLEAIVGPDHLLTAISEFFVALADARAQGQATDWLARAIEGLERQRPAADPYLARAWCDMAQLKVEEDPVDARRLASQCLELRRDKLALSDWKISEARAIVLAARIESGDTDAVPALRRARQTLARALGPDHPKLAWCDRWLDRV